MSSGKWRPLCLGLIELMKQHWIPTDLPSLVPGWQYRKNSCISRTKSESLNASRLVLQLFLPNPLKPGVKSSKKM